MNTNDLFFNKLKSIHKSIYSLKNEKDITLEIDSLYSFIQSKYKDLDFFKKFDELINKILNEEVIKNEKYTEKFVKKYLNIYFQELKTDIYTSWGLIFLKILFKKTNLRYPQIYFSIFKIYFRYFNLEYSLNELTFPIADEVNLFNIMNDLLPVIDNLINDSTSYNLLFNPSVRNRIILYLYDFYKKNKSLNIWFPCSGMGTEPLLFSLLMNLINEIETNDFKIKNFRIFCSDSDDILLNEGLRINPLNDLLLKTKSDFAGENDINEKDLNATIKDSKKNLIIKKNNFLSTGKYIEEVFDIVIINSIKLSDINFFKKKIIKRFNKLKEIERETIVILEAKTLERIDENDFSLDDFKPFSIISSNLISEKESDYYLNYLIFQINRQNELKSIENLHSLDYIFENHYKIDKKELKETILKIDKKSIKNNRDYLTYAYLLAKATLFNKAYDIIKNYYTNDYNFSYKILKIIINNSKNIKIIKKVENFISEKEIKEKGFTAELFDALIDGIEEYEMEEKKYRNKEKWL